MSALESDSHRGGAPAIGRVGRGGDGGRGGRGDGHGEEVDLVRVLQDMHIR